MRRTLSAAVTLLACLCTNPVRSSDLATMAPEQAVVVDPRVDWFEDTPGEARLPRRAWIDRTKSQTTFGVDGAAYRRWSFQLNNAVELSKYPILHVRYRAADVRDGTSSAVGVRARHSNESRQVSLVDCTDIDDDNDVHELVVDLRETLAERSEITGASLGVAATDAKPARLDLLGLWFEAADGRPNENVAQGPASTIRIIDPDGRPARGARVTSNPERANWSRTVSADDQGMVTVPSIGEPLGRRSLRVEAEGMVPLIVRERRAKDNQSGLPTDLQLRRARVYSAIARNEDGQPVAFARVEVALFRGASGDRRVSYRGYDETYTDEHGRWQTRPLDSVGNPRVELVHPDYARFEQFVERTALQGGVLTIERGHRLQGVVVDENNKPVPNVVLRLNDYRANDHSTTDSTGRFTFPRVKTGEVTFFISAKGRSPIVSDLKVDTDVTDLRFEMRPAAALKLRVVDQNGKPVPEPYVSIGYFRNRWWPTMLRKTGGSDGRVAANEAPAEDVEYRFSKRGYAQTTATITADGREHLVTMYPLLRFSGKVTDAATGMPIKQFQIVPVIQFRPDFLYVNRGDAVEGADGRYALEFERTDIAHLVRIEAPGYRSAVSDVYEVGQPDPTCDFRLEPAPVAGGVIVDADGDVVPAARVYLATPTQEAGLAGHEDGSGDNFKRLSDDHGRFDFPAPFEPYTVIAIHDKGYAEVALPPDGQPGTMTLKPWASVTGVLYQSGRPVPQAEIDLWPLRPRIGGMPYVDDRFFTKTDAQGRFVFSRVPPVKSRLAARLSVWSDYPVTSSQSVPLDIQPGQNVKVDLAGSGRDVTGRVVLPDADDHNFDFTYALNWLVRKSPGIDPSPAVAATGFDARRGWHSEWRDTKEGQAYLDTLHNHFVKLDPDGRFLISGVPPGEYELALHLYEPPEG